MPAAPEALARENIDRQLIASGWHVQSIRDLNLYAGRGIAVREFRLDSGPVDYLLLVDRQAVGVIEAKREGTTLTEVERQAARYGVGLQGVPAPVNPLPFQYVSTGVETRFTSLLDPEPRSREIFHFHQPKTLADWLAADPLRQVMKEFEQYVTPDDGRKFTELYNVQRLTSGRIDPVANVCISTIQRLYSMLQGKELNEEEDEVSAEKPESLIREPLPVVYNPTIPVEMFDVIFVDECHRSIYTLWRQVLEYFDAFVVGLTATPSKQTLGFFNQNLVTEYGHEQAVAAGVNVDFDVYRIRTRITEQGSKVDAGFFVDRRERETRRRRWEKLDEDLSYQATDLDREVVAPDQIRTVIRSFRDKLGEIFPGRPGGVRPGGVMGSGLVGSSLRSSFSEPDRRRRADHVHGINKLRVNIDLTPTPKAHGDRHVHRPPCSRCSRSRIRRRRCRCVQKFTCRR